jgi:hypothetical protein
MQQKQMFKVISPVDKGNGKKWWMRCGTAFRNSDNSINIYLEALPLTANPKGDGVTLQLREYTDEELRERNERKATYSMRGGIDPNGLPSSRGFDPNGLPSSRGYDPNGLPSSRGFGASAGTTASEGVDSVPF